MTQVISIKITTSLKNSLDSTQLNQLLRDFFDWKRLGPAGEFLSYIFGKDGFYAPPASPPYTLMHAHMVPSITSPMRSEWDANFNRKRYDGTPAPSRKVSNKALVYAIYTNSISQKKTYLLIGILDDPDSHEIIKRSTPLHDAIMRKYVEIAQQFIMDMKQPKELIDQNIAISSHTDLPA